MYVRDDKTDEIVAKHAEIQRAIRGGHMMGVVPGHGAHLLVAMALTFGWTGSSVGAYGLSGNNRAVLMGCLALSLVVATVIGFFIYRVLRGHSSARGRLYVFALSLTGFAAVVLVSAFVRFHGGAIVVASVGFVASATAARCIAGANYALFAAFLRAKRAHSVFATKELEHVRQTKR